MNHLRLYRTAPAAAWLAAVVCALSGSAHAANPCGSSNLGYASCSAVTGSGEIGGLSDSALIVEGQGNAPLALTSTNATFRNATIYLQVGLARLDFYGNTSLIGNASDGTLYLFGNPETAFPVSNHGTITQSGNGELNLATGAPFVNETFAVYAFNSDTGIAGGGVFQNNAGATLVKYQGGGISTVNVRLDQNGGKVEAWNGQILLNAGGNHVNAAFYADAVGVNMAQTGIAFAGVHSFSGTTNTGNGKLALNPGATINVSGSWQQQATFTSSGNITLASGTTLTNSGSLQLKAGSQISGLGTINNAGTVAIAAESTVQAQTFTQSGGALVIDGTLDTYGGDVTILGGTLSGNGFIQGNLVVGGSVNPGDPPVIAPGHSPGHLSVSGNFQLGAGAELQLQVDRVADGSLAWDLLSATQATFLAGSTVHFIVGSGVAGANWQTLEFLDLGQSASFDSGVNFIVDGAPGATVSFSANGLELSIAPIQAVPEPSQALLLLAGLLAGAGSVRWRRPRGGSACAKASTNRT